MENRILRVREILNQLTDANGGRPSHSRKGRFWNLSRDVLVNGPIAGKKPIEVGDPDESFLVQILSRDVDGISRMPRGGPYISDADLAFIKEWIRDGAPDVDSDVKRLGRKSLSQLTSELRSHIDDKKSHFDRDSDALTTTLLESITAAVQIEFATIPPYLTAMWSISGSDPDGAGDTIWSVVFEEMLHMGLMSNLFAAIAPVNTVLDYRDVAPVFPSHLPAGVRPHLTVFLAKLDLRQLQVFMDIESFHDTGPEVDTIGEFYEALSELLLIQTPPMNADRQIEYEYSGEWLFKIHNVDDAIRAINLIRRQGEGRPEQGDPYEDPAHPELGFAHYYQFAELYHSKKYTKDSGSWSFDGDSISLPDVFNIADVPPGGYPVAASEPAARPHLVEFNNAYAALLDSLTEAWMSGDQSAFGDSVAAMYRLSSPAKALMQTMIGAGPQTYAPDFIVR